MAESSDDDGGGGGVVIDRPSPSSAEAAQPLADNGIIIDYNDASESYCSTTSAESLEYDDMENHQQDDIENGDDTIGEESSPSAAAAGTRRRTVRTPSFSYDELARRPRSNPRTRTPLRNPSPLLGNATRATIHDDEDDDNATPEANVVTGSDLGSHGVTSGGSTATNTAQRVATTIRLNAGLPIGTLPSATSSIGRYASDNNNTSSHRAGAVAAAAQRSSKQARPSHRKIRRWNNDNMVGIVSDIISAAHAYSKSNNDRSSRSRAKSLRAADAFARGEAERMEFVMPNYPLSYRSAFDELTRVHTIDAYDAVDSHGDGSSTTGGNDEEREERRRQSSEQLAAQAARRRNIDLLVVRERFVSGEIGRDEVLVPNTVKKSANNNSNIVDVPSAEELFNRMEPRIRNVVKRAVISSPFAVSVMSAYEDVLVNRMMASTESNTVLEVILVRPVVMKEEESSKSKRDKKKSKSNSSRNEDERKEDSNKGGGSKVGRIVFHFHFDAEGTNAGFHRLLLHAVCQYHGMHASSTTVVNGKCDDGGDGGAPNKERVLTVTGTCKGRQHSIVKQAMKEEENDAGRHGKTSE